MSYLVVIITIASIAGISLAQNTPNISCEDLLPGQYVCGLPEIDNSTQAAAGCNSSRLVSVPCFPSAGTVCSGRIFYGNETRSDPGFYKYVPCRYVGSKSYLTAVGLSFLGMFGADRIYLGYPAIGLLKLCTFGFFMLGQLADMILIAAQVVGPADGTDYQVDFYGPVMTNLVRDASTFISDT